MALLAFPQVEVASTASVTSLFSSRDATSRKTRLKQGNKAKTWVFICLVSQEIYFSFCVW